MQLTKSQTDKLLGILQSKKAKLEDEPVIKEWKRFLALPYEMQQAIRDEWDAYYVAVKETIAYEIFQRQKEAGMWGRWGEVKELAEQIKLMKQDGVAITLDRPHSIDPFEYDHGSIVREYRKVEQRLKELSSQVSINDDMGGIFA